MMNLHQLITRQRGVPTTGTYGDTELDWTTPTTADYQAEVQPLSTDENVAGQERIVSRWRLFLPPGADVTSLDRVLWDGDVYDVEGEPGRWKRRGTVHHLELILIRHEGA